MNAGFGRRILHEIYQLEHTGIYRRIIMNQALMK
jgi:hypothetical protein